MSENTEQAVASAIAMVILVLAFKAYGPTKRKILPERVLQSKLAEVAFIGAYAVGFFLFVGVFFGMLAVILA